MSGFLVSNAIKKDYRNKKKDFNISSKECYTSIKYHKFEDYIEVEFYINKILLLIISHKKILRFLRQYKACTIITECLNREYVLRLLLLIMGFRKEVEIKNTFFINEKYYNHLIYCYYN